MVTEIIREKILLYYDKEIPYAVEVVVEQFKEDAKSIHINAVIYVERDSQKGIIIGKHTTSATPLAMEWTTVYESTSGFLPATEPPVAYMDLFLGNVGGCIGETSALALLIGGLFLLSTRIITPALPVTFIGTVALLTAVTGGDPLYAVLSGTAPRCSQVYVIQGRAYTAQGICRLVSEVVRRRG